MNKEDENVKAFQELLSQKDQDLGCEIGPEVIMSTTNYMELLVASGKFSREEAKEIVMRKLAGLDDEWLM
jgi:hypothetical protein